MLYVGFDILPVHKYFWERAMDWLFSLSGFIVGLLVGMTGVGGGALMTPLLVLGFQIPPVVAVGSDLIFAAATKSVGALTHGWQGTVQWRIVFLMAAGSVPSTIVAINYLSELQQHTELLGSIIQYTLSAALLLTAVLMLFKSRILAAAKSTFGDITPKQEVIFTILTGVLLGALVTITSIGAGAMGIVILTLLYPKLETSKIVGTDIAHAVPLTAIAGLGHFSLGSVDFNLVTLLLLGSIPGVYIGSRLTHLLPEKYVRIVLASILTGVGIKLLA